MYVMLIWSDARVRRRGNQCKNTSGYARKYEFPSRG